MLEDLILLCEGHARWFFDFCPFLLNNLTAVLLLLLKDLQGQLRVVIQFLQQIPNLLIVEQRIFEHDSFDIRLQLLLIVIEGHCAVGREVVLADY